ncbi:MAG: hypothetical protein IJO22_02375 [Oscillospiraceae bacterium]|nr:hypothetical protein [Oscillospiraceae bacterium]
MKKIILAAAAAMLSLAFSGCTFFEADTEALMHPPLMTGEQEKLNAALTEVIGENYELKYPKTGDVNSAFVFRDLDGDGTEEAMAFYSLADKSTRINLLKKDGDSWLSVYEAAGFYGDIESVNFAELDENNCVMVIKWEQEAGIYRYRDERLETVFKVNGEGADIVDMNGDGFKEVVLFDGSLSGRTIVNIIHSYEGSISVTEDISIYSGYDDIYSKTVGALYSVYYQEDENGNEGIPSVSNTEGRKENRYFYFLDSEIYEGVYLTEMIALEGNTAKRYLIADFIESEEEETEEEEEQGIIVILGKSYGKRGIFLRNTKAVCTDINGDGLVELPVEFREDYAREASDKIFYLQYMRCNGAVAYPMENGVLNFENGYFFSVPENWNEKISVSKGTSFDELIFTDSETGEVVFEIYAVMKSDYQDKYEDYILASEDETKNYYVKSAVGEESEFFLDPESYEERFIMISAREE